MDKDVNDLTISVLTTPQDLINILNKVLNVWMIYLKKYNKCVFMIDTA